MDWKGLGPTERTKLLRSLRSRDPKVVEAAVERLIWAPADDRPADFAVPLARILQGSDEFRQFRSSMTIDLSGKTPQNPGPSNNLRGLDLVRMVSEDIVRGKAARALVVWATPEAEAASGRSD